ncbi:phage baseplate assembly protein V [Curvibacter gracilis]|uniref:phage baseplate assembly protein V n=1 Tax=Curvibacter gracilis TaxID=230310 RepID=UPI0004B266D5|nr:phage baseplate assembly protein V [Curvibacter gracilis]
MHFAPRPGTINRVQNPTAQPESPYELNRKIENIVRLGSIEMVRLGKPARCRVRTGGLLSNWVPFFSLRAGGRAGRTWWPPVVGEQCVLLCPGGDLLQGVALVGLFSDDAPQGSEDPNQFLQEWSGDDSMSWLDGELLIQCRTAITLQVGDQRLRITPESIRATPDLLADTISVRHHHHGGVQSGFDITGEPQ